MLNTSPNHTPDQVSQTPEDVSSGQKPLDMLAFLNHVLPEKGKRCCVEIKDGETRQNFCDTNEELATRLFETNARQWNAYFATQTYLTSDNRKAENVQYLKSFRLDLDAGKGKPYADFEAAKSALMAFIAVTELPVPTIVCSGFGLHCYWTMVDDMGRKVWTGAARQLKDLAQAHGLQADDKVTDDATRILRPINTLNWKKPEEPKEVYLDGELQPYIPNAVFMDLLNRGRPSSDEIQEFNAGLTAGLKYSGPSEPSFAAIAVTKCREMQRFRDSGGNVSEPEWYAHLCVLAHCADGEELAHQWSSGYDGYSEAETGKKLEHARSDSGPTTCAKFQSFKDNACGGCPFSVKSPISLGRHDKDQSDPPPASTDEWPDPKPIQTTLYPVAAFDPEKLLPEPLRGWIMDEADRMPCPPDYVAVSALTALGSIVGARCVVKPKTHDDWQVVPNLWGGIVGQPSAKKSPALQSGMVHLNHLAAEAHKNFEQEKQVHELAVMVHKAKETAIEARLKEESKKKSGGDPAKMEAIAKELQVHRTQTPKPPVLKRYKTNDATVEKLGELLSDNPQGVMVLRDELVGMIASWEKAGHEGDRAFYLEAWNGNTSFDTDRIGRGSIFIPNLCLSLFGGIQPDKLLAYLEQAANALNNDGLLQRFQLLVYPDHCHWKWRNRTPDREARARAYQVIEKIAQTDPVLLGAQVPGSYNKFPGFHFDQEAQDIYIEWATLLHTQKLPAEDNPMIQQHLSKYEKLFAALALLFHMVECAATERGGPITKSAAVMARSWCEYLETHARRCYGMLADGGLRAAQALADKIQKGKLPDGFTARDVCRNQWRSLTADDKVQAALSWLVDEGWLHGFQVGGTGPGGGRPTMRYTINPKVARKTE